MRFVVVTLVVLVASAARAGEWFVVSDADLDVADEATGASLIGGSGFTVTHDATAQLAHIHATTFSAIAGPDIAAPIDVAAALRPAITHDGVRFYVSGDGDALRRSDNFAVRHGTNDFTISLASVAADPLIGGRAMVGTSSAILDNASVSSDGYDTFAPVTVGASNALLGALGLHNNKGVAVAPGLTIYVSGDVGNAIWVDAGEFPPAAFANGVVSVGANVADQFLAVGPSGSAALIADTLVADFDAACSDGGADFTAIASLGLEFWIARADGTIIVVDVSNGCPWSVLETHSVDPGQRIHGLSVASDREVLAVTSTGRIAWRNRAPLPPTVTRQGAGLLAEGAADTLSASADDPDLGFAVLAPTTPEALAFSWSCQDGLVVGATNAQDLVITGPDLCVDTSFSCAVTVTDAEGLSATSAPISVTAEGDDTSPPTASIIDDPLAPPAPEGASVSLGADANDDCDASLAFAWDCPGLIVDDPAAPSVSVSAATDLCPAAADPAAPVSFACSLTVTDDANLTGGAQTTVEFDAVDTVPPSIGSIAGVPADAVFEFESLSFSVSATDDCDVVRVEWSVTTLAGAPVSDASLAPGATFDTPAPGLALGATRETFVVSATAVDVDGNAAQTSSQFDVEALPPLDVSIACPTSIEAGSSERVIGTEAAGSGPVQSWEWRTNPAGFSTDTDGDAQFEIAPPVCSHGQSVDVSVVAHPLGGDGDVTLSCPRPIEITRPPTPPDFSITDTTEELVLSGASLVATIIPDEPARAPCPQDEVRVIWDLSQLPRSLQPRGTIDGVLDLPYPGALLIRADASAVRDLVGDGADVIAFARDDAGVESGRVTVRLLYPELDVGISVRLASEQSGALDDGELVVVSGEIASTSSAPLPSLRIVLVGNGLTPIASTFEIESDCGAAGAAEQIDDAVTITVDGVTSACAAKARFVARRGLRGGGLSVARCSFGAEGKELVNCSGGIEVLTAPALSCASTRTSPPFLLFALVVLHRWRRYCTSTRYHF